MRVFVYPEKTYEELGSVRYEASWEQVKKSAEGKEEIDPDFDLEYLAAHFKTKEEAVAYARKVVDSYKTAYGSVTVSKQVVDWFVEEDRIAEWADAGDEEIVD